MSTQPTTKDIMDSIPLTPSKGEWQASKTYNEDEMVRFGEAEYMRVCKKVAEKRLRTMFWVSFIAMILVGTFGLVLLIAGCHNILLEIYGCMQFATVTVHAYANWQCYRHKVKID
jgi:hypothetical protein